MNSSSNTGIIELDPSKSFLCIILEYSHYIAGDRIIGEVLMNALDNFSESNLILYSSGCELLNVMTKYKKAAKYNNEIFHVVTTLKVWEYETPKGQYNFPFTFKLPYFAPSTFSVRTRDNEGNLLEASVVYEIKVALEVKGEILLQDTIPLQIFNNKTRCTIPPSVSETELSTCLCFKKGHYNLSLTQINCQHPNYYDTAKFKLELDWFNNKGQIAEVYGKILYKLQLSIPGDKTYEFTIDLCEFKHSNSFFTESNNMQTNYEFDVNLYGDFGDNVSSNATAMINSTYIGEATVVFNLGVTNRIDKITLPMHVNPKVSDGRVLVVPSDWEASPCSLLSIYLQSRTGNLIFSPTKTSIALAR
ncbi:hypothetical protein SteCoe_22615 [Stentor coeruleus]|uniref:Arrestin-like N-terminal domain-containing protein n=1 Tax=Stentor coeruleus TaxID=5963 RepID=A0A1R2BLR5_9CILI|nr:hypothetical protein SteCoe_22615 [Stentor coeruleus]